MKVKYNTNELQPEHKRTLIRACGYDHKTCIEKVFDCIVTKAAVKEWFKKATSVDPKKRYWYNDEQNWVVNTYYKK